MRQGRFPIRFLTFGFLPLVTSLMALVACVSTPKKPLVVVDQVPSLFRLGESQLQAHEYAAAFDSFDSFLQQKETSSYTQSARYDSALALESLGNWQDAVDRYRVVASANIGSSGGANIGSGAAAPQLQALALYRLSYCLEVLGDDTGVIAVLTDLRSRSSNLPTEVAEAEVPARLAAAYARIGEVQQAEQFYGAAEKALEKYSFGRASGSASASASGSTSGKAFGEIPEWLPQTLFEMGHISERKFSNEISDQEFAANALPIARAQTYLLQDAELGREPWATKSVDELVQIYKNLWDAVLVRPLLESGDTLPSQRRTQERQWARAQSVLELIADLKSYRLPRGIKDATQVKRVFSFTSGLEKKLHALLSEPKIGRGLTPEAEERKTLNKGQ